jgi:hypothetical protein
MWGGPGGRRNLDTAPVHRPVWSATVGQVAEACPGYARRVLGEGGRPQDMFDEHTRPTAQEVEAFLRNACDEVLGRVGLAAMPLRCYSLAAVASKWHAAAAVEAEYGSASEDTESAFRFKRDSYVATLNELVEQARRSGLRLS